MSDSIRLKPHAMTILDGFVLKSPKYLFIYLQTQHQRSNYLSSLNSPKIDSFDFSPVPSVDIEKIILSIRSNAWDVMT